MASKLAPMAMGEEVTEDIKTQLFCVVFILRTGSMLRKQHNLVKVMYHTVLMAQENISAICQRKGKKY